MPNPEPLRRHGYYLDTQPRVLAGCKDAFHVGDFMRWEGEPGASLLVRGHIGNSYAVALEHIDVGQTVELVRDEAGWLGARLAR